LEGKAARNGIKGLTDKVSTDTREVSPNTYLENAIYDLLSLYTMPKWRNVSVRTNIAMANLTFVATLKIPNNLYINFFLENVLQIDSIG
jgi:predicted RNA-binding protein with PUA-like domain